jgi:hypothetical protein
MILEFSGGNITDYLFMNRKRNEPARNDFPVYKDKRLNNRPGEKWKDIPGLDGYYLVSTLGRIKRQEREVIYPNGSIHILSEKIISPRVIKTYNNHMRDYKYQLFAHLIIEGGRYYLPIRRLVYCCFVKPFEVGDKSVSIVSINGDGQDISPDNLKMINKIDHTKRIYEKKRMVSIFRHDSIRQKGVLASLTVTRRQVSQYDKKGKRVNTFASVSDAARATGINLPGINHAANGTEPTAGGFFWRFGKEKHFDVKEFLAGRKQGFIEKRGTKVTQYDSKGNPVAQYQSLQEAGKAMKGHWTSISAVIRGKNKTAYGYRWIKGYSKRKIKPLPSKRTELS